MSQSAWIINFLRMFTAEPSKPSHTMILKTILPTLVASLLMFSSCERLPETVKPEEKLATNSVATKSGSIVFTTGAKTDLIKAQQSIAANKSLASASGSGEVAVPYADFDMTDVIVTKADSTANETYLFKSLSNPNKVLAIYDCGTPTERTVAVEASLQLVVYINYTSQVKTEVSQVQGMIQTTTAPLGGSVSSITGKAVVDCMSDVYTGRGWVSVWATVQSAFIPLTAAAIAARCALS